MQGLPRALLLMACCAPWSLGQDRDAYTYPKLEYFAGYSAIETNNHTFFFSLLKPVAGLDYDEHGRGFDAEVVRNLSRWFSIVGDFSAHLSSNQIPLQQAKGTQNIKINPELFDFLAGPEVKWRNHTRITPFANALFGLAHSTATLNTSGPLANLSSTDAETGFGMAFNGGFEFRTTRRVGLRGFLTYSQAFVGSDVLPRQRVDAVGWCIGVIFH
jgi:hypothetical protein